MAESQPEVASTSSLTNGNAAAVKRVEERPVPSWKNKLLFFLILSGPPKFRLRDPSASLESIIDWVIVLQIVVWAIAGCWVFFNRAEFRGGRHAKLSSLERLSIALFVLLALSISFSEAPAFSAFKVYQLVVTFAFVTIFAKKFGAKELLNNLFLGCSILALADAVAAFLTPDLVFVESELGSLRFRGDLIAQTGVVSVVGLILLLTVKSDLPRAKFAFWMIVLGGVLVCSLMRTSYLAMLFVLVLAAFRRPAIPVLRRLATFALISLPLVSGMLLSALDTRRQAEDIWTLSDRIGLWSYLIDATVKRGPWFGLGYFSASRVYAPEYNPGLGTAHSAFMEIYAGGGMFSLLIFVAIWMVLAAKVARIYTSRKDGDAFAVVALFCAVLFLNAIGGELQAEQAGFCFWSVVAVAPLIAMQRPPEMALSPQ